MKCPDGGTCHHDCVDHCFRVRGRGPLSGVFPGDDWPESVKRAHGVEPVRHLDLEEFEERWERALDELGAHGARGYEATSWVVSQDVLWMLDEIKAARASSE